MKSATFYLPLLLQFILVGIHSPLIGQELKKPQQEIVMRLQKLDPNLQIRWDATYQIPAHLRGKLSDKMEGKPEDISMKFLMDTKQLFKIKDVEKELSVAVVKTDDIGWQHVSFQQVYKGIPVDGNTVMVHINSKMEVRSVRAHFLPDIDINVDPQKTSEEALESAIEHLESQQEPKITKEPFLVIFRKLDKTYLAWKIGLYSKKPLGAYDYFIDAHSGEYIYRYSKIKEALDRETYTGNHTYNLPGTLVISEGQTSPDDTVQFTHNHMAWVYNYFKNSHGRDSWDGGGATIITTVHHGVRYNNAFWSPDDEQFAFGCGDGIDYDALGLAYDLVVHEFVHAITDKTAKFNYERQSGALHESFSDIFACITDDDWMIGEDVYTPATTGDAGRYLDDPTLTGQPDHMNNFQDYAAGTICNRWNDYCGVHTNSGIPNKAGYLIIEGDTHNGISVCGIGRTNAAKIFYRALTIELLNTPNASFQDTREAMEDATSALFQGDLAKLVTVQNAYAAVGIGDPYSSLAICLEPSPVSVKVGNSQTLTALVTDQGIPVSGADINLNVANTNRATINTDLITTAGNGEATCSVSGVAEGTTILTATTIVGGVASSANISIKIYKDCDCACSASSAESNKPIAWIMLTPAILILYWRYRVKKKDF